MTPIQAALLEISGPPLEQVRHGWFLPVADAGRSHWFDVVNSKGGQLMRRLCDGMLLRPFELREPGTWQCCKHCRRMKPG